MTECINILKRGKKCTNKPNKHEPYCRRCKCMLKKEGKLNIADDDVLSIIEDAISEVSNDSVSDTNEFCTKSDVLNLIRKHSLKPKQESNGSSKTLLVLLVPVLVKLAPIVIEKIYSLIYTRTNNDTNPTMQTSTSTPSNNATTATTTEEVHVVQDRGPHSSVEQDSRNIGD